MAKIGDRIEAQQKVYSSMVESKDKAVNGLICKRA